jgi:glucokinase
MSHPVDTYALVADIGGTNTRVALTDGLQIVDGTVRKYRNADYPGLDVVLRRYIADEGGVNPIAACVAVAGPVRDGAAQMTNLDWAIDLATLSRATGAEHVAILNDLQAQGHALGHIADGLIRTILPFPAVSPQATRLVIGVGTGFNAAPVFMSGAGRVVAASESGHVSLPVRTEDDMRLADFVGAQHGFPSVEDVLSGRGLEHVHAWIRSEAGGGTKATAAEIMGALATGNDALSMDTARVFVRILGSVAGNLALIQLPFGGVFFSGGVARAIAPYLGPMGFKDAFCDKGRFAGFMEGFGVGVIEDDFAALTGCAAYLVGA